MIEYVKKREPNQVPLSPPLGRLIVALGRVPSGSCTLNEGAELIKVSPDLLTSELLKFKAHHRLIFNAELGKIWRN